MARDASVIFAGHVEAVTRNDEAGYVDVQFRIVQPLRGCPKVSVYVLREWSGLWSGHPDRYRAGQRLLMLLPARGPSGMSAPVGGMDGAIPIVSTGTEPLANGAGTAPADDGAGSDPSASEGVDLRWIAARGMRGTASAPAGTALRAVSISIIGRPALPFPNAPPVEGWSGPVAPLGTGSAAGGTGSPAAAASLSSVLSLLRGTSGATDGPR